MNEWKRPGTENLTVASLYSLVVRIFPKIYFSNITLLISQSKLRCANNVNLESLFVLTSKSHKLTVLICLNS